MLLISGLCFAANFHMPVDGNSNVAQDNTFIGCSYFTTHSTDTVKIASGDVLIYNVTVVSDGSGTDNGKITTATAVGSITTANTKVYIKTTTSENEDYNSNPGMVADPYAVVNNTGTIMLIRYKVK